MNITSLYYFKEVVQDLNLTKTATRLFISQQALSKSISQLEKECANQLFFRKPHLRLTPAGEAMLRFAKEVLDSQRHFTEILSDVSEETRGTIRFGASSLRSSFCLTKILPKFSKIYPNVNIEVTDNTSANLQNLLLEDELDVALCSLNENITNLSTKLVLADNIYFCAPDRLLQEYYPDTYKELKQQAVQGASLENFAKLPFLTLATPNKLGATMTKCFEEAGFTPKSYLSATFTRMYPSLCASGLAACVCTQMTLNANTSLLSDDMNIFHLLYNGKYTYHNIYLTYPKGKYITKYLQLFMALVEECYATVNIQDLSRIS